MTYTSWNSVHRCELCTRWRDQKRQKKQRRAFDQTTHVVESKSNVAWCRQSFKFHQNRFPRCAGRNLLYPIALAAGLKPNHHEVYSIMLAGSKLIADQLRTSFEPASVMEFGFYTACTAAQAVMFLAVAFCVTWHYIYWVRKSWKGGTIFLTCDEKGAWENVENYWIVNMHSIDVKRSNNNKKFI